MNLKDLGNFLRLMRGLKYGGARGTRTNAGRTKPPYVPGTIGLSPVSAAIIRDHGRYVDRRTRRLAAKRTGKPFKAYYNGPVSQP